jgi:hypothetical protein
MYKLKNSDKEIHCKTCIASHHHRPKGLNYASCTHYIKTELNIPNFNVCWDFKHGRYPHDVSTNFYSIMLKWK